MSRKPFLVMAALLSIASANQLYAQDEGERTAPEVQVPDRGHEATARGDRPRAIERPAPSPPTATSVIRTAAAAPAARDAAGASAADEDQRRRRDGGRDRGDNPNVGRAVPREAAPPPGRSPAPSRRGGFESRSRGVFVAPRVYNNYYSYPRRYYPYGYGAFGLGYFYYDPYTWYPPSYYPGYYGSYSGGYSGSYSGGYDPFVEVGELRLLVSPRFADVYVDGYFAGRVDDYDGTFQGLKLEAGPHHIQIAAQGYAPLEFDVRIEPRRKITYRGALRP